MQMRIYPQQARNVYTTLALGHIYVTSYMNVCKTLSNNSQISYYLNVAETLHIRL